MTDWTMHDESVREYAAVAKRATQPLRRGWRAEDRSHVHLRERTQLYAGPFLVSLDMRGITSVVDTLMHVLIGDVL